MSLQDELVKRHFGWVASFYGEQYKDCSPAGYLFSTRLKRIYELFGNIRGSSVLDVGCGPGMPADYLINRDCGYVGIDLSNEMLLDCQSRFGQSESVQLGVGNMKMLPFPNDSFDIILCLGALEYIEDANNAVREISRVVKEKGEVIIAMQNKLSLYRLWDCYVYRNKLLNKVRKVLGRPIAEEPHLKIFSAKRFCNLLAKNQFNVTDVVYYDFNVLLAPLDRYFPRLSVFFSGKLEPLYQTKFRGLGTGFIVKAQKDSPVNSIEWNAKLLSLEN